MTQNIVAWTEEFLGHRKLEHPDGRALYAYRCLHDEFDKLGSLLTNCPPNNRTDNAPIRAFVLYASEWWQRDYDGGTWAWEPLLESIGWGGVHYPDLYEPVKRAWAWWKVDLVRLPTSIRYLGTFACQGGLPLALLGDAHSSVTRYLRAVLKHVADYRQFVDDFIVLAQDQQHLLRPPTLRRDYVFQLSADLVEAVLELQEDAQGDDPLGALNNARPDWEQTMPLALDDQRARDLLTSLLREAVRNQAEPVADFRVERFLRQTGKGWKLGARIRLPTAISTDSLARHLKVRAGDLPPRLQVRTYDDSSRLLGLYALEGEEFSLLRNARCITELWDKEAAGEIRVEFLAGSVIGEPVLPNRGSVLGELPWSFLGTDDCRYIGEGSVASRVSQILILVPDGCTLVQEKELSPSGMDRFEVSDESTSLPVRILDRTLWSVTEKTNIETKNGCCVIRPASGHTADEEYRLSGSRFYELISSWPLFRGQPRLLLERPEQHPRAVPSNEIEWRQIGGEWLSAPTGPGLWEARYLRLGELRFLGRMGILPDRFSFSVEPGFNLSQGDFFFDNTGNMRVAGGDSDTLVNAARVDGGVRVRVDSRDVNRPPAQVCLRVHWPGAQELNIEAPFPGQGGRFLREGCLVNEDLAVDDLYGVRATALSPVETQEFWVEGELKAPDVGPIFHIAYFRKKLRKSGIMHELPISEVRRLIDLLLSGSSSADAHVVLRILDRSGVIQESVKVSRFSAVLDCNPELKLISVSPTQTSQHIPSFDAYPLIRPGEDPVSLETVGTAEVAYGALLPHCLNRIEPWLIVMRHDDKIRARPFRLGNSCNSSEYVENIGGNSLSLSDALAIEDEGKRIQSLEMSINRMLDKEDAQNNEAEWSFLTNYILGSEGLPSNILDIFRVLVRKPKFLVRCLFRLESGPRQRIWDLEEELPFSWLLIHRQIWWSEVCRTYNLLQRRLKGVVDSPERMAKEHVVSILTEGEDRLSGLVTVATDVALRLEGGRVRKEFVEVYQGERDNQTPVQIGLRTSLDDWPKGYGRKEWKSELGTFPKTLCHRTDEYRARQPFFDTPVAAAWCCFRQNPTERTTFLVKQLRAHDREWFDLAYSEAWFKLAYMQDNIKEKQ